MYMLLAGLKEYFRRQEIVTDNVIFRLHYIFTTVLLIAFSLLVTATQVGQLLNYQINWLYHNLYLYNFLGCFIVCR